jgi:hypothetical protein
MNHEDHKDLEDKISRIFFFEVFVVFAVQLSLPNLCEIVKSITTIYRGLWSQLNSPYSMDGDCF